MNTLPVYTDFQSVAALRDLSIQSEASRLESVAGQFSAVFTHMMLKSMRDASLGEGIFDSQQSLFYRDMFDQQLALHLSQGEGVGIASMLADHLRDVTGIEKPEENAQEPRPSAAGAVDAYATVQALSPSGEAQDRTPSADTGSSRNETQGAALHWKGLEPR
ncbi:MAG: rod-binding protein [Pseudomonadota bacterium]